MADEQPGPIREAGDGRTAARETGGRGRDPRRPQGRRPRGPARLGDQGGEGRGEGPLPVRGPGRAQPSRPAGAGLGAAADPQLRRAADLAAPLRRPVPRGALGARRALRRAARRRPGGVRAPLRGPVRRLTAVTTPLTRPGRLVAGRYRLLSQIGGGGMGTVWTARDELLGRTVALKQVLPPTGTDPGAAEQQRQRSLREGRIAARLSHPHAISVYDVAMEGDQPWLVMEYLPSRSLAAVLAQDGVLRVEQAAQIGAQVADALAATHAAGIVHRDVKPANVLIGEGERIEGLVKITDFGISHASGDVTLTQTGQITGTPAFLAPEVAQGEEPSPASDVFSLGATLYTCLEGRPPFGMSGNSLQQLHRVAAGRIDPPQHCGALTGSLLQMLAADPADRPSMARVRDELASLIAPDGDTTTVLTARTDLRPSAAAPQRTATFPVPSQPAQAEPPPAQPAPAP